MIIPGIVPNWLTRDHEAKTVSRREKTIGGRGKRHAGGGTGSEKDRTHVWNADLRLGEREGSREEAIALWTHVDVRLPPGPMAQVDLHRAESGVMQAGGGSRPGPTRLLLVP